MTACAAPVAPALLCAALLLAAPALTKAQGHAHLHGVAALDIAVDARSIVLHLRTPLDNLVGFERAPRNDAERCRVDAALARLRGGDALFRFDAAAGCKQARVDIESAVLKLGPPAAPGAQGAHAELEAEWLFDCADAARAAFVDVGLFAFDALQRIQLQLALPQAQLQRELKRPATRVVLRP